MRLLTCVTVLPQCFPKTSIKLLAYNISSNPLHFDSFIDQCLEQTDVIFDVTGFCETCLNDAISCIYNISMYIHYSQNKNTHGGVVAIF